jgi:hypothetical protein
MTTINQIPKSPRELEQFYRDIAKMLGSIAGIAWSLVNKAGSRLNEIVTRPHSDLQEIRDWEGGTNDRHISVDNGVDWQAHVDVIDGNPHGTDHAHLDSIAVLDPTSTNATKDRHLSDAQGKVWQDHVGASANVHGTGATSSVVGTGTAQTLTNKKFGDSITLPKTQGEGIKVDVDAPDFTWWDLIGLILYKDVGAGSPLLTTYRGNIRDVNFAAGDDYDLKFHIDHDWAGKDCYIHVHWSHNGTDVSGSLILTHHVTYAKGHGQDEFPDEKTITQTIGSLNVTNTPQYRHRIDEIQLSVSGGSATLLDTDELEPDGLILIHFDTTTIPTITGGSGKPFIHFVDVHYQSTNVGTKQKSPAFYA